MKTAFPLTQVPVQLRLYSNIPFDNTYKNHSLISSLFKNDNTYIYSHSAGAQLACERFLDVHRPNTQAQEYIYPRFDLSGDFNFNFQNGLLGSVTLELTPEQTNANYMRLKTGDAIGGYNYYYYFITGINQVNYNTFTLSLELDVLMTYQDDFLQGISSVPVFTARKHCYRYGSNNNGTCTGVPHSPDFKTGDSTFNDIKPTIIKKKDVLKYYSTTSLSKYFDQIVWAYVCYDTNLWGYSFKGTEYPLSMYAFPVLLPDDVDVLVIRDTANDQAIRFKWTKGSRTAVSQLLSDGSVHGCKLSPYAPFDVSYATMTYTAVTKTLELQVPFIERGTPTIPDEYPFPFEWNNDRSRVISLDANDLQRVFIYNEKTNIYNNINGITLDGFSGNTPVYTSNKLLDPKLLFKPFRKYKLTAPYSSGQEIYPELIFGDGNFTLPSLFFRTIASTYIGDNNISTYLLPKTDTNSVTYGQYYLDDNFGNACNLNYTIPAGTNALDVFNSTQAQAFYQSKNASGLTAGLTIAGGIASIGLGIAGAVGTFGMGAGASAGLVVGGLTAISGGVASMANTIKSTEAKLQDLQNTPDSFNVQGSSFTTDFGRTNELLPYVLTYECTSTTIEKANEYFYNFGYEVARECYFNTQMKYLNNESGKPDCNLFGRKIFNYIQINDDITNKINANIPLIAKQKLNAIFNNGITLWSFFGFQDLWVDPTFPINNANNPFRWLFRCTLDNTEFMF